MGGARHDNSDMHVHMHYKISVVHIIIMLEQLSIELSAVILLAT